MAKAPNIFVVVPDCAILTAVAEPEPIASGTADAVVNNGVITEFPAVITPDAAFVACIPPAVQLYYQMMM